MAMSVALSLALSLVRIRQKLGDTAEAWGHYILLSTHKKAVSPGIATRYRQVSCPRYHRTRRHSLKLAALAPLGAASAHAAYSPLPRTGKARFTPTLNAYSFLEQLNANLAVPTKFIDLFGVRVTRRPSTFQLQCRERRKPETVHVAVARKDIADKSALFPNISRVSEAPHRAKRLGKINNSIA